MLLVNIIANLEIKSVDIINGCGEEIKTMAEQTIKIITGKVKWNIYGDYEDCDRGLYIDGDKIETLLNKYEGKVVKLTIEEVLNG